MWTSQGAPPSVPFLVFIWNRLFCGSDPVGLFSVMRSRPIGLLLRSFTRVCKVSSWPPGVDHILFSAALLCLQLAVAVGSTRGVMASGAQNCALVQQMLRITRLTQRESADLIKTYVSAQNWPNLNFSFAP